MLAYLPSVPTWVLMGLGIIWYLHKEVQKAHVWMGVRLTLGSRLHLVAYLLLRLPRRSLRQTWRLLRIAGRLICFLYELWGLHIDPVPREQNK